MEQESRFGGQKWLLITFAVMAIAFILLVGPGRNAIGGELSRDEARQQCDAQLQAMRTRLGSLSGYTVAGQGGHCSIIDYGNEGVQYSFCSYVRLAQRSSPDRNISRAELEALAATVPPRDHELVFQNVAPAAGEPPTVSVVANRTMAPDGSFIDETVASNRIVHTAEGYDGGPGSECAPGDSPAL